MFHRPETNWIGFQEAQRAINSLKEEVEIAEKKISNAKKSFIKVTAKRKNYEEILSNGEQLIKSLSLKRKEFNDTHSSKEKVVPYKGSVLRDEGITVPKTIFSASEEEPDIPPPRIPYSKQIDIKKTLISFDNYLSTTDDSASVWDKNHSSSERTSSLIASTYRDADKLFKKYESKEKVATTDISKSSTIETSEQYYDHKEKKKLPANKSSQDNIADVGKWTDAPKSRAFFLQNRFKIGNIYKLKDIIDKQKKRQELNERQLEQDVSESSEHLYHGNIQSRLIHQPEISIKDDQVLSVPVRKVRVVKSLPNYKGFSAPPKNLPTNKRWRKQRSKHTIANPSNFKNYGTNPPKRIKQVIDCENKISSQLNGSPSNNVENFSKSKDSKLVENSRDNSIQDEVSESKKNDKAFQEDVNIKNKIQSILNASDNQLLDEDSLNDVKDTFSNDVSIQPVSSVGDNNQNIMLQTKKLMSKNIKRKPKTLQEQNVPSPKVKQYDVTKIRAYIKSKKEERRKRHLEEHKRKILEEQKIKESLDKLFEYQKQKVKAVPKVKPLSPVKIPPKDSLITENNNEHPNRNDGDVQTSVMQNGKDISKSEVPVSCNGTLKRKLVEDTQKKCVPARSKVSSNNSPKEKQENVHIDISIPKFISATLNSTQSHKTNLKDTKISSMFSDKANVESLKNTMVSELVNKPLKESSLQQKVTKTTEVESYEELGIDFDNSQIFKDISSVSTPSGISQLTGIDSKLIEEIKVCEDPLPETKQRKDGDLRELVETLNMFTEPIEPLLYTKQWLSKNPLPPKMSKSRISKVTSSNQQQVHSSVPNDTQPNISQSRSFKEHVSGIGDVSQLYAQILGKKLSKEVVLDFERQPALDESSNQLKTYGYHSNEDEIIEGSLKSEAEYILERSSSSQRNLEADSETSDLFSHFSDLQKENIIPDPFNFINTWKKKPLGFTIRDKKAKTKTNQPVQSSSNIPIEDLYKSLLNVSSEGTRPESFISETSQNVSVNQNEETSALLSDNQDENCMSRTDLPTEISSNISQDSKVSSSKSSSTATSRRLSKESSSRRHISNKSESHLNKINEDPNKNKTSEVGTYTEAKRDMYENISGINSANMSDAILSGTIDSEYTLENEKCSRTAVSNEQSINASDAIFSGTINSEFALDVDAEKSGVDQKEVMKEHSTEKASPSESSISEVISVVENSKGFKSSVEDILSNRSTSSKDLQLPSNDKSISSDKNSEKHVSENIAKLQTDDSIASDQQIISDHSSEVLKKDIKLNTSLQKNGQYHNIPLNSQNNVTIDIRHPLRLTLTNEESLQPNQELNVHESQYLHTQVVTRVASEAAAAAATSAVIAVFETQKALLAEKNHLGIFHAYGTSNKNKKIHSSSDFESSADALSSSPSQHSGKNSGSAIKNSSVSINNENSPMNESVEEEILSNHSSPVSADQADHSKSSHGSSIKTDENQLSVLSGVNENAGQQIPERNRRKISSNISSPSPASLSDNGSATTETSISSHSDLSHLNESAFSDDSFAQLTLDAVRKMTEEEQNRASLQLAFLRRQEKDLVEKARYKMACLELLKKKCRQEGKEKRASAIKKEQKELILRLRQERALLQYMQNLSLLKDKKKLLKKPSLSTFELLNKDDKPNTSKNPDQKLKELFALQSSSSTPSLISDDNEKAVIDEDSASEIPEIIKGVASNSSQESVIETQPSEITKSSGSSQNKSQRSSPNPPFSSLNVVPSNSNPSLHSSNSLESVLQGLKKLEASKRHLTKREQRILQRRKTVEHLLQWQKKLDNEEKAVRELEKKALDIVDHSRKKTKYYVSSSGSNNHNDNKRQELNYESLPPSSAHGQFCMQSTNLSTQLTDENGSKTIKTTSNESIHTSYSSNELEVGSEIGSVDKRNVQASSVSHSPDSFPGVINNGSKESSIQTVEAIESNSQAEEVASEEISNQISVKDKSSSSDVYSESFESTISKKYPSVLNISPPFKTSRPSKSTKKDYSPGIRLPLVPRNLRRHDSSGSDDSYTISQSETASDQSDIEVRIHALSEEIKRRKVEAEKLKREQKKKNRERLKEKELSLQKQLEAYNRYIHQAKLELDQQIESAISPCQTNEVVKPQIKWPRPEKVDSHQLKKQASVSSEAFALEKKTEINVSPEVSENYEVVATRKKDEGIKKNFPKTSVKNCVENINKEISDNSDNDYKEVSEAFSINSSTKVQDVSDIVPTNSVSSEIPSEINENTLSSTKSQDSSEIKSSDLNQKSSVVSSLHGKRTLLERSDSKSQTDTFTSESTSLDTSDLNSSQKIDENSVSNKTISSYGEQNSLKAKESSEKSTVEESFNISQEVHSSEDSVSEIPSVNNSVSVSLEEDLDCGVLSKNSKCNGSEGCEIPFLKEVAAEKNVPEKLSPDVLLKGKEVYAVDATSTYTYQERKKEKKQLPDSEIVNITNYLSASLINDAFCNLFEILNKRGNRDSFINHKSSENKLQGKPQSVREKTVEAFAHSLLDLHLKDAFSCLFKVLGNQKIKSQKSELLHRNSPNVKSVFSSMPLSVLSVSDNNTMMVIEETCEFPFNQLSNDINSNQIFVDPTNLNVNYLTTSENEQQFQQQQLVLQQFSYFYRKIPNKPPPPYTPPSSPVLSSEFPFVKEKQVEKITTVKKVTKHINEVVDHALEVIVDGKSKGLPLSDISLSKEDLTFDKLELSTPPQSVFVDFVFDLTKEIVLEKFSEAEQVPQPWLRPRKLTPKPLIPSSKELIQKSIQKDIEKALKINEETKNPNKRKQFSWSSLKLGRKKRDFVDTILISELKEEEPDWVNYDQDEVTVKLQIADSIFNVLINDTICTIKSLQQKLPL